VMSLAHHAGDGDKQAWSRRGEHEISRKTIAQGRCDAQLQVTPLGYLRDQQGKAGKCRFPNSLDATKARPAELARAQDQMARIEGLPGKNPTHC
jgi:hypothetical protein